MKKLLLFSVIFSLFFSLALAVNINLPKTDYSNDEPVAISIQNCLGKSILEIYNSKPELIGVEQGVSDWQTIYHTKSDPYKGKYKLTVNCADATTQTKYFCVDSSGCTAPSVVCGDTLCQPSESCSSCPQDCGTCPSSGGGGGGGRRCTPRWSCGTWSFCSANRLQTRVCFDQNRCQPNKIENQTCTPCLESWICSLWSQSCQNNLQNRKCYDEHHCGTAQIKPNLQKACRQPETGHPPAKVIQSPPEQFPGQEIPQSLLQQIWNKYRYWLIPLLILIIVAVALLFLHFHQSHGEAVNFNELKDWVKAELKKGVAPEQLHAIVRQQTGWNNEEFNRAVAQARQELSG